MDIDVNIFVLGINHKSAGIEIREKCSFRKEEIFQVLQVIGEVGLVSECVIVSTCNRTEIYGVPKDLEEGKTFLQNTLNSLKNVSYFSDPEVCYFLNGYDAIRHLFTVAAGANSQILGEPQILGQVKDAYFIAVEAKMTGPVLNKLFHFAFHVGKRVRTETRLGAGAASVGSTAVQLLVEKFGSLKEKSALLIGTGETGKVIARHLHKNNIGRLYVANRTLEHAVKLADELNAKSIPFFEFPRMLGKIDILLSATRAPEYILTKSLIETFLPKREGRQLLIIDVAVPRDVEEAVHELEQVVLYDVDDLSRQVEIYTKNRLSEIPEVKRIIREEMEDVKAWMENLRISQVISRLQSHFEETRKLVVEKNKKNFDRSDWEQLERITTSLINKILSTPLKQIKEYNRDPSIGYQKIETVSELFSLNELKDSVVNQT